MKNNKKIIIMVNAEVRIFNCKHTILQFTVKKCEFTFYIFIGTCYSFHPLFPYKDCFFILFLIFSA